MKTTKEMIEVMEAFERGEKIEVRDAICLEDGIWESTNSPLWNWSSCDYRVKPKKKYVPFDTVEEFLAAQRKHGFYVFFRGDKYTAFINANGIIRLVQSTNILNAVVTDIEVSELEYILKDCKFEDGTPCGKEVEE